MAFKFKNQPKKKAKERSKLLEKRFILKIKIKNKILKLHTFEIPFSTSSKPIKRKK